MLIKALRKLQSFGFEAKNILDIGAHKGKWSMEVRKKVFPNATYTLVEAINYDELKLLSKRNDNINFLNLLLDEKEQNVIWHEKKNTGDSIFKENTSYFDDCEKIERLTTTLDKSFTSNYTFDLIKIDCQGAELPILKGGKRLIKSSKVIILEVPFMGKYNIGVPNFFEHIKYMQEIGYSVFDIVELHRVEDILIQIDLIFINNEYGFDKHVDKIIKNLGS